MIFITPLDFILLPFYLVVIYMIAYKFREAKYPPGHPWRPYFIPGLTVKMVGGIFIGLIYQYYYVGGDTGYYFIQSKIINNVLLESPWKWFNLVMHIPEWWDSDYAEYISQIEWYTSRSNYIVCSVTAIISLFTFSTFLPTTVILAAITYTGIWAMFRTFAKQYPSITRYIAVACLFIPSVFMWGSGIFKDTLCLFALGWLTHIVFRLFIERRISSGNLVLLALSLYLLYTAKIYILLAYLPSLALWVLLNYSGRIRNRSLRSLLQFSMISVCIMAFFVVSKSFTAELGQYSMESIIYTSGQTRDYILSTTKDDGAGYTLDIVENTPAGLIMSIPAAINVTLFRPYIWEARKPIVMLNALEACAIMLITIKVIFNLGLNKIRKAIATDANIQFCLIFSLIFAFAVGISSFNFGTLSRYRIPCIPMYVLALILIYYKYNPPGKSIFRIRKSDA